MLHQQVETSRETISPALSAGFRHYTSKALRLIHRGTFIAGMLALIVVVTMFTRPDIADDLLSLSPFSSETEEGLEQDAISVKLQQPLANLLSEEEKAHISLASTQKNLASEQQEQGRVAKWLSRRYRVAHDATTMFVSSAYTISKDLQLDPLLILSVVAIESRFNPFAESPMGAQGLMQVMSKVHRDKFESLGGLHTALNPIANMRVGSMILKEYIHRQGSIESGLRMYVGASAASTEGGYGMKVLSEYAHLKAVSAGRHVSVYAPMRKPANTVATGNTTATLPVQAKTESDATVDKADIKL